MFPDNVKFISTPRFIEGGAGTDCFGNFNLALHVGDEPDAVSANRESLEKHYKLPSSPIDGKFEEIVFVTINSKSMYY